MGIEPTTLGITIKDSKTQMHRHSGTWQRLLRKRADKVPRFARLADAALVSIQSQCRTHKAPALTPWFVVIPSSPHPHQINRLAHHHRADSAEPCGAVLSDGGQILGKEV